MDLEKKENLENWLNFIDAQLELLTRALNSKEEKNQCEASGNVIMKYGDKIFKFGVGINYKSIGNPKPTLQDCVAVIKDQVTTLKKVLERNPDDKLMKDMCKLKGELILKYGEVIYEFGGGTNY